MDILDRIVEAVAQKLISLRLNEEKDTDPRDTGDPNAGKKSGSSNPGNKPKKENKGKENFHQKEFVPPEGTKELSHQQAGVSGGESVRTGRLSRSPNKEKVKITPVRPVRNDDGDDASKKGGQEAGRGGNLDAVIRHFRKTRGNK
jgi:hypothetical protein